MQTDIKQLLPTTVRQGLLAANSPSTLNPFATIADLTASITGTVNRAAMFIAPNIVGNASWEYIGTTYQPVTTGSYFGSPTNNIGRFHTNGWCFFEGTPDAGLTAWVFKYQGSPNWFFSIEPDSHASTLADAGNYVTSKNLVNTGTGPLSRIRLLLSSDTSSLQFNNNASTFTPGNIFNTPSAGNMIKSGGLLVIGTSTAHDFVFATGTLERARITSTGSVGIGTPTPTNWVQILNTGAGAGHLRVGSSVVPLILDVSVRNVGIGVAGSALAALSITTTTLATTTGIRVNGINSGIGYFVPLGSTSMVLFDMSTFSNAANYQAAFLRVQTAGNTVKDQLNLDSYTDSTIAPSVGLGASLAFRLGTVTNTVPSATHGRITVQWHTGITDSRMGFYVFSAAALTERMSLLGNGALGLGTTSPVASALLEMISTTRGFLPPRMTNAQRTAIVAPAIGLIVYCTDVIEGLYINKSTGWTFII